MQLQAKYLRRTLRGSSHMPKVFELGCTYILLSVTRCRQCAPLPLRWNTIDIILICLTLVSIFDDEIFSYVLRSCYLNFDIEDKSFSTHTLNDITKATLIRF